MPSTSRVTTACVVICLAVSPPAAAKDTKPSLALLNVRADSTSGAGEAQTVEGLLIVGLEAGGRIRVTGRSDISTILGFEQQKQLLGCEEASCTAELAGALGVDFVASADIGRLGDVIVLNVKVINTKTATAVARASRRVSSSAEIPVAVDGMTQEIVAVLLGETSSGVRRWSLIGGAAVTGLALLAGAYLGAQSQAALAGDTTGTEGALVTHTITERNADRAAGLATGANALFVVGAVAGVATGVGFFVTLPSEAKSEGGGAGVTGSF